MLIKLEWLGYRTVQKLWRYVKPFSSDTGTLRTDRRTDRFAISISRVSMLMRNKNAQFFWDTVYTSCLLTVCHRLLRKKLCTVRLLIYLTNCEWVRRCRPGRACEREWWLFEVQSWQLCDETFQWHDERNRTARQSQTNSMSTVSCTAGRRTTLRRVSHSSASYNTQLSWCHITDTTLLSLVKQKPTSHVTVINNNRALHTCCKPQTLSSFTSASWWQQSQKSVLVRWWSLKYLPGLGGGPPKVSGLDLPGLAGGPQRSNWLACVPSKVSLA